MIDTRHRHRRARRAYARSEDVCVPPFLDGTSVVIFASHLVNRRAQKLVGGTRTRTRVPRSTSAPGRSRFNTHSGAPRPPQTPAASFKRLYRE